MLSVETIQYLASQNEENTQIHTDVGKTPVLIAPEHMKVTSLEQFQEKPSRINQSVRFDELSSFIDYVNEFKDKGLKIFGKKNEDHSIQVDAQLDYHQKDSPAWNSHLARMKFSLSPEFKGWAKLSDQFFPQDDFAEYLESVIHHIVEPDGATMLETVVFLEATRNQRIINAKTLQNGAVNFLFAEEVEIKSRPIPPKMTIEIPVYENTPPVKIDVLLKYRLPRNQGDPNPRAEARPDPTRFGISMVKVPELLRESFKQTVEEIENKTGTKVLWGGFDR